MYNLNTYAGRLRALADKRTIAIHTEWNGILYVNIYTLHSFIHMVERKEFKCTLEPRPEVTQFVFDDVCEAMGFAGVVKDELRENLFGEATCSIEDILAIENTVISDNHKGGLEPHIGGKPC